MKQLNADHVINSLANRLTNAQIELAKKDAAIIGLSQQVKELEKNVENFKGQIKEDENAE